MSTDIVRIFDTTLRDGEQSPGFGMNTQEKVRMAHALEELNVDIIEAGFAAASEGDFEAIENVSEEINGPRICSLARCHPADIEKAGQALEKAEKSRIHIFIATSPIHREFKLKMSKDEILERAARGVEKALQYAEDVEFSAEDAIRTEHEYLAEVVETVIATGAKTVNIPDTVGYSTPDEIGALFAYLGDNVKNSDDAVLSIHCHNDLGLAVANSLAAVKAGARQIECTINGIGERAGNCSLEEAVMAMRTRKDYYGVGTNIVTQNIFKSSQLLAEITGNKVARNKAIVGANAFAHEAGIHQDGMLKNPDTYEIMKPEDVGAESALVLGKHSGRHAFQKKLEELGYNLNDNQLEAAFFAFKALADLKKNVTDADIRSLVGQVAAQKA